MNWRRWGLVALALGLGACGTIAVGGGVNSAFPVTGPESGRQPESTNRYLPFGSVSDLDQDP